MIFWGLEAYSLGTDNMPFQYSMILLASVTSNMSLPAALAWPMDYLKGSTAFAVAPAIVVGVGNIGGIVGPQIFGLSYSFTGSYSWAAMGMSIICFLGVIFSTLVWIKVKRDAIEGEEELLNAKKIERTDVVVSTSTQPAYY